MYKILGLGILVVLISLQYVNAEERTFNACYADLAGTYLLVNSFSKYTVDLQDPQFKQYISSLCDFYHEKTGQWLNVYEKGVDQSVIDEFYRNNMNMVPEQLRSPIQERLLN